MKQGVISALLTAGVLLIGANQSLAADSKAAAPSPAASKATVPSPAASKTTAGKGVVVGQKPAGNAVKLVDINSAKTADLMKLPGITEADAAKIIAGRPYSSKADLSVRKIIDAGVYENLKKMIIAKQPFKDAAKNAALYGKKK